MRCDVTGVTRDKLQASQAELRASQGSAREACAEKREAPVIARIGARKSGPVTRRMPDKSRSGGGAKSQISCNDHPAAEADGHFDPPPPSRIDASGPSLQTSRAWTQQEAGRAREGRNDRADGERRATWLGFATLGAQYGISMIRIIDTVVQWVTPTTA